MKFKRFLLCFASCHIVAWFFGGFVAFDLNPGHWQIFYVPLPVLRLIVGLFYIPAVLVSVIYSQMTISQ